MAGELAKSRLLTGKYRMKPPDFPPPFPSQPPALTTPRRSLGLAKVVLIVLAVLLVLVGSAALFSGLAVPAFRQIQGKAHEITQMREIITPPLLPLTAEQNTALEQFGRELAQALTDKDNDKLMALQDIGALAARVFEKLPQSAAMRRGFMDSISKDPAGLLKSLFDGEAVFLRVRERHDFPAALVRIKTEDGAVSYADILVSPHATGFKAVDVFDYICATLISEDFRNIFATMVSKSAGGTLAAILGMPKMDDTVSAHIDRIVKAAQEGDMHAVLRICEGLPSELQTQRYFFIMRLKALTALSSTGSEKIDRQYRDVLHACPDILGKESSTDLLMCDLLFMENNFQGAEECVKRMEKVVGGDSYLTWLRGGIRLQMKDYEGTLALANQAQREDPTMAEAADLRISVHLERKDFKAAVGELRNFKRDFDAVLDREALSDDEVYKELLASPEFAAWEKEIAVP